MNKAFYFYLFFSLLPVVVFSQTVTVSGFVYDESNGEALIGATVFVPASQQGAVCNEFGFYSLTLPESDSLFVEVSFTGYQAQSFHFTKESTHVKDFLLKQGIELQAVEVTAQKSFVKRKEISFVELPVRDIQSMPNLFGEVDIVKAFQLTAGVQSGGEGNNSLYVRGGSPDQNLVLLDDVPLYYVSHFGGFFSVFNADALKNVKLIKGGFPARYGGRLSSVVDVRMKEGDMQKMSVQGSLSILSAKATIEAPVIKDKMSFMFSARKNISPLYKLFFAETPYSFYDLNGKINYKLSDKNRIYFSSYLGNDILTISDKAADRKQLKEIKWGNRMLAFRWNHIFSPKLFSNFTLYNSRYRYLDNFKYEYETDSTSKKTVNKLRTGVNDFCAKIDMNYLLSPAVSFRFGANTTYHIYTPNDEVYYQSATGVTTVDEKYKSGLDASENAVYTESELDFGLFSTVAGVRGVGYFMEDGNFLFVEPRLLVTVPFSENLSVKYSYANMHQFIHLLAYSGTGVPSDYWMPATATAQPEFSEQHSAGLFASLFKNRIELSLEVYHKSLTNLITFRPGKSLVGNLDDWEKVTENSGSGENYGVELFAQKKSGKTTGWLSTTLSVANRGFETINGGKTYPFKYDRLLDISAVISHRFGPQVSLSATWNFGTGYPMTLPVEHYFDPDAYEYLEEVFIYGEKNSYRMRDYHRLDIAANFTKQKDWGERIWTISIFNVYARKNPYYYYFMRKQTDSGDPQAPLGEMKLWQKTLFGFFPSVSYGFKIK